MNIKSLFVLSLIAVSAVACSKQDNDPDNDLPGPKGKLLYSFAGKVSQLDLASNVASVYFTYNTYGFNGWDMGRDGQYRLLSEQEAGVYHATKLTRVKNSDGAIVDELEYDSPNGNGTTNTGKLSPDNVRILFAPDLDNGVVMTDLDGNVLTHLEGITTENGEIELGLGDEAIWLPDNSILFTADDRYIFKSSPPYTTLNLVKEMPYTEWGNLRANHAGTKIAMMVDMHIHVMDIDGQHMTQVTNSKGLEFSAVFSPDDNYLAVAKRSGSGVGSHGLLLVPNDGRLWDVDSDPAVTWVQPEGENIPVAVNGHYCWIP